MPLGLILGLGRAFRRKRTSSLDILSSKRAPRNYYKGKNCKPTGFHTRKGLIVYLSLFSLIIITIFFNCSYEFFKVLFVVCGRLFYGLKPHLLLSKEFREKKDTKTQEI